MTTLPTGTLCIREIAQLRANTLDDPSDIGELLTQWEQLSEKVLRGNRMLTAC